VAISILSTRYFGSDQTSAVIIPMLHWLFPAASHATLLQWHHLIRKTAHFTEYFVFSMLLLRAIRAGRRDVHWSWALEAIGIVALYASLDEFHQMFVPGRTSAVGDVLIDTTGGVAAQLLIGLVLQWKHRRERTSELERGRAA
jgi:VanZ family protein